MRSYVSLTSALLVWLIYRRYRIDMEIQRAKQMVGPEGNYILTLYYFRHLEGYWLACKVLGRSGAITVAFPARS
jgi:hypothetical protein